MGGTASMQFPTRDRPAFRDLLRRDSSETLVAAQVTAGFDARHRRIEPPPDR